MKIIHNVLLLLLLLVLANLYLLRPGLWTFQDASYWPNTSREAFMFLNQPLQAFSNYGYYLGFENGVFVFTRIGVAIAIFGLYHLFGSDGSQAMFSLLGNLGAFLSFYLFSGLLFANKNLRYFLSLAYAINPLVFQLQGHTYFAICIPLYIYSFVKFVSGGRKKGWYLLLNILAVFIWVAYVRFIQGFGLVIIPYLVYMWRKQKFGRRNLFDLIKLGVVYILILSPTLVAVFFHLRSGGSSIFNYASVYGSSIAKTDIADAFNLFYSQIVPVFRDWWWRVAGLMIFGWIIALLTRNLSKIHSRLLILNLGLILGAVFTYNAGNILTQDLYARFVKLFPYVVNSPVFALYVLHLPLIVLLGQIGKVDHGSVRLVCIVLVAFSSLGFANIWRSELAQLQLDQVPQSYRNLWPAQLITVPESTLYIPNPCWVAKYQIEINVPKPCLNYGLYFSSLRFDDPRIANAQTLNFAGRPLNEKLISEIKITHNMKNIILAKDLIASNKQIQEFAEIQKIIENSRMFEKKENDQFIQYRFFDSSLYDFFIYSPQSAVSYNSEVISKDNLPVITNKQLLPQDVRLFYKYSPDYPERVLIRIENYDPSKELNIQFNQTFSKNWRLFLSNSDVFEKSDCITQIYDFPATKNRTCVAEIDAMFLDSLRDSKASVSAGNHLSQLWTMDSSNSTGDSTGSDLYLELRYIPKKFIEYAVMLSSFTLIALIFYSIVNFLRND